MKSKLPQLFTLALFSLFFTACTLISSKPSSPSQIINQSPSPSASNQSNSSSASSASSNSSSQVATDWPQFNSTIANFRCRFPTYPDSKTEKLDVGGINMEHTQYSSVDQSGNAFLVAYSIYTNVTADQIDPVKALEGSVNGSASVASDSQVLSSAMGTFRNKTSVDYVIHSPSVGVYFIGRNFLVGNQLYQIMLSSASNQPELFTKFADTFDFVNQ